MNIVSRAGWNARAWAAPVYSVPLVNRTEFMMHYHGGVPPVSIGPGVPRDCEAIHLANGWAGIGYNFVIDQAGTIFEGRGWNLIGAHCPGHNTIAFGVYVAVGLGQEPTPMALNAARGLYDQACKMTGNNLRKTWHGANYPTDCPGIPLITWVQGGMLAPEDDDVALTDADVDRIAIRTVEKLTKAGTAIYEVHDGPDVIVITDALTRILKRLGPGNASA